MKKQAFFRFWLIVCIIALTIPFASCDENVAPAETTAEVIDTAEITNVPETTIIPETTSAPETTKAPETTSATETTKAPETTSVPETTKVPETTSAPETTNAPKTTEAPHVHAWSSWVTVFKATCTAEGKQERNCSCGEKETESISALGHTEVIDKAVSATCTTAGKTEGKHCSVCKAVIVKQNSTSKTSHNYGEWKTTTAATCTAKGKQERTCSTCGRKESQTVSALGHTESEWIIDKAPTCQSAGSQHTKCTVCNKKVQTQTIAANQTHKYEGNFCELCGKKSPDFEFPSGYITTKPIEIETEYCILKIDENVYVVDGVAKKVDIVCRALEEVTGLKFKNDTYGKDKVVINVTHGEKPWGVSGESERPFKENTKSLTREIQLAPVSLFIADSDVIIHELAHALHFSQTKWSPNDIFIEGFATYATHLALQYLADKHTDIQYSLVPIDYEIQSMVIYTDELYKEKIEYWFEHPFTHMPHYHVDYEHYTIGFRIMWYLHDTYGNFTQWILFRESIDPASNHFSEKHNGYRDIDISNEDWFAEIKQIYGAAVLDNFYPWLKANEGIFEFDLSTRAPYDLTNIEYTTIYPMFDYATYFVDTGYIAYDHLYINLEEAKMYLSEYKGKAVKYLRIGLLQGDSIKISYYDKDGNLLDSIEAIDANKLSYIKLNGSGISSLELYGVSEYEENGLGFRMHYPAATENFSPHYDLKYIYECETSHLVIPSEVNGLPVKQNVNHFARKLDQVTEITISEGIEQVYMNTFTYLTKLKTINLPSTINKIGGPWQGGLKTIEIFYTGTKSDWEAIQKFENWDSKLTSYTIHCTDGDITKVS